MNKWSHPTWVNKNYHPTARGLEPFLKIKDILWQQLYNDYINYQNIGNFYMNFKTRSKLKSIMRLVHIETGMLFGEILVSSNAHNPKIFEDDNV
jgi:hypothetical protein